MCVCVQVEAERKKRANILESEGELMFATKTCCSSVGVNETPVTSLAVERMV